jgi:hypothetical protein
VSQAGHIFEYLIFPFLASLVAAIVSALLLPKVHATILQLSFALIAGGIAYVVAVFVMDQKRLRQDISLVKQVLWNKG